MKRSEPFEIINPPLI